MFNLQGGELVIILLLALVVLGPEKLPEAMRKAGQAYAQLKKISSGFQQEFRDAIEEPAREMRNTADMLRDSADFTKLKDGDRTEKPKSAMMGSPDDLAPADPDAVPSDDVPFTDPVVAPPPFAASQPSEPQQFDDTAAEGPPVGEQPVVDDTPPESGDATEQGSS